MNIWQWQDKTHVIADFPNGARIRLTVGACSGYENGVYSALMQEARTYIKDTHGVEAAKFIENATPEQLQEWSQYHQRAIMLSTLLSVETRENEADEWKHDELPDEWRSIAVFARAIPSALYDEWLTTAIDLNPGQFIQLASDEGKKNVKVNARRLTN